jgi:hypothetical protein
LPSIIIGNSFHSSEKINCNKEYVFCIKLLIREIGLEGVDSIHLAQDRDRWQAFLNMANEPWGSIKCGEFPY